MAPVVFYLLLLWPLLNHDFLFQLRSYPDLEKKVSLVAIFVCKPLATEIAVLFLCSLELSMQKTKWKRHAVYSPPPPRKIDKGKGKDAGEKRIRFFLSPILAQKQA